MVTMSLSVLLTSLIFYVLFGLTYTFKLHMISLVGHSPLLYLKNYTPQTRLLYRLTLLLSNLGKEYDILSYSHIFYYDMIHDLLLYPFNKILNILCVWNRIVFVVLVSFFYLLFGLPTNGEHITCFTIREFIDFSKFLTSSFSGCRNTFTAVLCHLS